VASHRAPRLARALLVLVAIAVVIVLANMFADWIYRHLSVELTPRTEPVIHQLLMLTASAYILLIALPFVPGVEIGLAIILLYGREILLLVYLCTLAGLSISFLAGRVLPAATIQRLLADLALRRASDFVGRASALGPHERLDLLLSRLPGRLGPLLRRYRYVALGVALNIPGNGVIGGGGGIVFLAGLSGVFSPPAMLLTLALAISPVPLFVLALGTGILVA
jgi:hypothetical protein